MQPPLPPFIGVITPFIIGGGSWGAPAFYSSWQKGEWYPSGGDGGVFGDAAEVHVERQMGGEGWKELFLLANWWFKVDLYDRYKWSYIQPLSMALEIGNWGNNPTCTGYNSIYNW